MCGYTCLQNEQDIDNKFQMTRYTHLLNEDMLFKDESHCYGFNWLK